MIHESVPDLAGRLALRAVPGRREWRGNCPVCGYSGAFILTERAGRALGWCASCQNRASIAAVVRGGGAQAHTAPTGQDVNRAAQQQRRRERALRLWHGAAPAKCTIADTYLAARALPGLAASPVLRFRLDTPYPGGGRLPAMVALVTDGDDKPMAIHRTFLRRDGTGKADVEAQRATLGPATGGAIRLDPAAPELVIGEGIETSASAGRLIGLPAWAAGSAGNLAKLVLPPVVRRVVIAADADNPGERGAREAALRWQQEGRSVRIARLHGADADFNDLLRAQAEVAHA